jgi:hypothetical protein
MEAACRRRDVTLVECLCEGAQARYARRPQLSNYWRKIGCDTIGALDAGSIGGARGAVAQVATG